MTTKMFKNLKKVQEEVVHGQNAANENQSPVEKSELDNVRTGIFREGMHRSKRSFRNKLNLSNLDLLAF
jgi:hypothetical protein